MTAFERNCFRWPLPTMSVAFLWQCLAFTSAAFGQAITNAPDTISETRPMIAIWEQDAGYTFSKVRPPYLRVAIWSDGNILFAKNPTSWGHDLRRGKIPHDRIDKLKKAIEESGVFAVKVTGIYPVDLPQDYIMVDVGKKQQLLSCYEGGLRNVNLPERDLKRCWQTLNKLALAECPEKSESVPEKFTATPKSWFLEKSE